MNIEFLDSGSEDCPLIRIFGIEKEQFASFRQAVIELGQAPMGQFALHELPRFVGVRGCEVVCVSSPFDRGLRRVSTQSHFAWEMTSEKWVIVSGLIEPFLDDEMIGSYQWLCGPEAAHGLTIGQISALLSCSTTGEW